MAAVCWSRVDAPHAAAIPFSAIVSILHHRFAGIRISLFFSKHEQVFVSARRSIFDTLRHRIRFVPYDIAAQEPSVRLQSKREPPRHPE